MSLAFEKKNFFFNRWEKRSKRTVKTCFKNSLCCTFDSLSIFQYSKCIVIRYRKEKVLKIIADGQLLVFKSESQDSLWLVLSGTQEPHRGSYNLLWTKTVGNALARNILLHYDWKPVFDEGNRCAECEVFVNSTIEVGFHYSIGI